MPELPELSDGIQYLALPEGAQAIVQKAKSYLGSLNDGDVEGMPYFSMDVSSFDDDRWAGFISSAIGRVNLRPPRITDYDVGSYPYGDPNGDYVLYLAVLIEAIGHFIIAYTESPDTNGLSSAPYMSRRDYVDRWREVLSAIQKDFEQACSWFKASKIAAAKPAVMLGGRHVPFGYVPKPSPTTRWAWGWY